MGNFGEDFSRGLALGVNIYDNAQRNKRQEQEQQWRTEDRKQQTDERNQMTALGNMMGKWDQGDFSPAIAQANATKMFGKDQYAAGARLGDDGNIYAKVYNNNDPVNSLQEVNLGPETRLKNQMFMQHAPPRLLANIGMNQMVQQSDPAYQQRLTSGDLDIRRKQQELQFLPQKQGLAIRRGQAALTHSAASIAAINQAMQDREMKTPYEISALQADAALKQARATHPVDNRRPVAIITRDTPDQSATIKDIIYDPNDPRRVSALAGPSKTTVSNYTPGTTVNVPSGVRDGVYEIGGHRVEVKNGKGVIVQ